MTEIPVVDPSWWQLSESTDSDSRGFNTGLIGERGLIAAILYRAVHDLSNPKPEIKSNAREFFKVNKEVPHAFTFLEIAEYLSLCPDTFVKKLKGKGLL